MTTRVTAYIALLAASTSAFTQPARLAEWAIDDFKSHGHVVAGPSGQVRDQFLFRDWQPKTLLDLRQSDFFANENGPMIEGRLPAKWPSPEALKQMPFAAGGELYPVSIRSAQKDVVVLGGRITGVQPREIPWRLMKGLYDGDGIRIEAAGEMVVRDAEIENVEDAVSPRGSGYWTVQGVWGRYIRDDFVENDGLLSGEIIDCLAECHVFLSARPGRKSAADTAKMAERAKRPAHVKVRDCVVHVPAMPYDGDMKLDDQNFIVDGRGGGKIFKWSPNGGTVEVTNTLFRVDAVATTGPNSMIFPRGTYRDVTLVWLGKGEYPGAVPDGVNVTKDAKVWENARDAWLRRHGKQPK